MNEDIADGYKLSRLPHKRAESHFQMIGSYLKNYFMSKDKLDADNFMRKIERKCSFNKKSLISNTADKIKDNYENKQDSNYLCLTEQNEFNKRFLNLNQVEIKTTIHNQQINPKNSFMKHPSQTSLVSNNSYKLVASKSASAPLSTFNHNNNDINNNKDNNHASNCTSSSIDNEVVMRKKTDKYSLRGYLNKYSKIIEFLSFLN
jgi:hypothetical protein